MAPVLLERALADSNAELEQLAAAMQRNTRQLVGWVALVLGIAVLFIVVLAGALHCCAAVVPPAALGS